MNYQGVKQSKHEWVEIDSFPGYFISNYGEVKKSDGYLMKVRDYPTLRYRSIGLVRNGKQKTVLIHRLIAIAFVPNPQNKPQVNHIDGDRRNNAPSNLEWVTPSENVKHAWRTGLTIVSDKMKAVTKSIAGSNSKLILDTQTGIYYSSAKEASVIYGCNADSMARILRGERKNYSSLILV